MIPFRLRLIRNTLLTGLVFGLYLLFYTRQTASLQSIRFLDGWVLLGGVLILVLMHLRKQFRTLPLGDMSAWFQFHIYGGLLILGLFFVHCGFRVPEGYFNFGLWLAFVILCLSGLLGVWLSRWIPLLLQNIPVSDRLIGEEAKAIGERRQKGERFLFERIPAYRAWVAARAKELVLRSLHETASASIAAFYRDRLRHYFNTTPSFLEQLLWPNRTARDLRNELSHIGRYLDESNSDIMTELEMLVDYQNQLNRQYFYHITLKVWLFVHLPLAYGLLVLLVVHVILVYAFSGGGG